jgi:hypothetical protein
VKSNTQERVTWVIILILATLMGYKMGGRIERARLDRLAIAKEALKTSSTLFEKKEETRLEQSMADQYIGMNECPPMETTPPIICPACDCTPVSKPKRRHTKRRRPPTAKPVSPVDRQKLLAWVKKYSPRLKRCRDAGQPIYKLHTKVTLNAKKDRILRTKVTGVDVPSRAVNCIEQDLKRWPSPSNLSPNHPQLLIFGLQLD